MSNHSDTVKAKASGHGKSELAGENEARFSIQPHPAKTNDPSDLNQPAGGGLRSDPVVGAHHARDPHIPKQDVLNSLEQPLSREELRKRQAELNK
ncbi:uncharacterized protein BT62DRAFT_938009 [Guyanagaster necrorhizus]|uniref:Uncharacterized protein n=1 Tax=Guyanagaster necrorhizus TaxID=856835 RepID=A0A9P7VIB5_9AGAR|nr:uncharacterized protein BT62DRAFT_938009 [Guyanagaster necrorhizus MCA 3950]KAG7440474.1 hypothetical protein BT62DRAFT_938009 [Guyanagaster necrorhizus MCA 3950]